MGTWAEAGIGLVAPVGQVVPGAIPGAGVIRQLIGRQASGGQMVTGGGEHRGRRPLVQGQGLALAGAQGEGGAGLDG